MSNKSSEDKASSRWDHDFWIAGEPASAKNQRQIVKIKGISRLIKSKKALDYSKSFSSQCPILSEENMMTGDIAIRVDAYYSSRRPDLACMDLVKDLLQGKLYKNDRQVKVEVSTWNLDKENPRIRIRLMTIKSENCTEMSSLDLSTILAV